VVDVDTGRKISAYLAGKMRIHYIRIVPGDTVMAGKDYLSGAT
jgi:translation initiation factor IF-1